MDEEKVKISLTPECISLRKYNKRPASISSPIPYIKKHSSKKLYHLPKRLPITENLPVSLSTIKKCIKVNSVIKYNSFSSTKKRSVYHSFNHQRYKTLETEESSTETSYFLPKTSSISKRNKGYYRIRQNLIPQTNAIINKRLIENFSLYLKGSQLQYS